MAGREEFQIITMSETILHICKNVGQVDDGVRIEQKRNTDGTLYFRAWTVIRYIFGSEMGEGAPMIEAFGTTEQQARERLDQELRSFNDSLFA